MSKKKKMSSSVYEYISAFYHHLWMVIYGFRFFACISIALVLLVGGFMVSFKIYAKDHSFWNLEIAGVEFNGALREEVELSLEKRVDAFLTNHVVFNVDGEVLEIAYEKLGAVFDMTGMVDSVMGYGDGSFFAGLETKMGKVQLPVLVSVDEEIMRGVLNDVIEGVSDPINATIEKTSDGFEITEEIMGHGIDFGDVHEKMVSIGETMTVMDIWVSIFDIEPKWTVKDFEPALKIIRSVTSEPVVFYIEEDEVGTLDLAEKFDWFVFNIAEEGFNKSVEVSLKKNELVNYVENQVTAFVEGPEDVYMTVDEDGEYVIEGYGRDGERINSEGLVEKIYSQLAERDFAIELEKEYVRAKVISDLDETEGIVELIGMGESDFKGSTSKRLHNITTGISKIDGVVLDIGKEFSFGEYLGPVNGSTGYEKELVIKAGGVTEADYGGGLCQVSTTTYRGVLNSGLPVTQRRNHSYYVKYYAPAGTDATIYPPYVDLMFENDTPGKVYIQTRVVPEKSKAYVYFWGTHDGRVVDVSPVSQRFDEVSNGNRVYEDVDWLEPGQVRMKDHGEAKDGFWTVQTSEVTYPDGTVRKDDFKSNYRAFPAFYYRGKQREVAVVSDVVSGE